MIFQMPYNKTFKPRFDFEIGYLVKSPCKTCEDRNALFPGCSDTCRTLDDIHAVMAQGVASTRSFGAVESFALMQQGWKPE